MTSPHTGNHENDPNSPIFEHGELGDSSTFQSRYSDDEVSNFGEQGTGREVSPEEVMGRMGQAFVNAKKLTQEEVTRIIQLQRRRRIRFGEAAIKLGLLNEADIHEVLAQQFNYQTVARHPSGGNKRISRRLLIAHSPYSAEAEAIRRFRSEILLRVGEQECMVFALVSPGSKEGKSHLAASLAIAFSQLNLKTLLIDANLRKPAQHQFFDLPNKTGLSTMLAGRTLATLDLAHTISNNLYVLTSGPKPPNPIEILNAPSVSELIERIKEDVKVIILDTPPTRVGSDAQIIAPQAGMAIMVCRKDQTSLSDLRDAYRDMETASVPVLGSFYNDVPDTVTDSASWLRRVLGRFGTKAA